MTCQIEWCDKPAAPRSDSCLVHMAPAEHLDRALSPATLADYLGNELTDWQRKFLDDVFDPSHKDEHLEWRQIGRKIGYGWVWVPNTNPMTWEFCRSCGGGGWVGARVDHKHPGCGHRCTLCDPPPGYDRTYAVEAADA